MANDDLDPTPTATADAPATTETSAEHNPQRRNWLQRTSLTAGLLAASRLQAAEPDKRPAGQRHMAGFSAAPLDVVRIGLIGVGQRGNYHARTLCDIAGCEIRAIADPDPKSVELTLAAIAKKGKPAPDVIAKGERGYQALLDRKDIDAVIIATPWEWHVPMALDAMKAGKHAFVEVPAATSIDDAWALVNTAEQTGRHCMMLENVCYGQEELMLLNMIRSGLFGELLHGEAAYIHDLRWQIKEIERSTGSWRTFWHARRNGNLYPTHGLGPIAQYFGINRGDRFDYINSQSTPSRSFALYSRREFAPDHPRNKLNYINGDLNTSLIKCASGRTIMVQHDTASPRPYSRHNYVQGTNGAFGGFPNRIAIEMLDGKKLMDAKGKDPAFEEWDTNMAPWEARYNHPLWKKLEAEAKRNGGHGGMDFIMMWRIIHCLRNGLPMDQDVYDAAAWSAVFPLSCDSVADRGNAKDFPDFTRGGWRNTAPLGIIG